MHQYILKALTTCSILWTVMHCLLNEKQLKTIWVPMWLHERASHTSHCRWENLFYQLIYSHHLPLSKESKFFRVTLTWRRSLKKLPFHGGGCYFYVHIPTAHLILLVLLQKVISSLSNREGTINIRVPYWSFAKKLTNSPSTRHYSNP